MHHLKLYLSRSLHHAVLCQSPLTLCDPMDCSPQGSSVHGVLQARTLEWVAIFFSKASQDPMPKLTWGPRPLPWVCHLVSLASFVGSSWVPFLLTWDPSESLSWPYLTHLSLPGCCCSLVTQSCPILCDLMDCSPPGSSAHGILWARILEWVAISCPRGSSQPRDRICVSCGSCIAGGLFTTEPPGKPNLC